MRVVASAEGVGVEVLVERGYRSVARAVGVLVASVLRTRGVRVAVGVGDAVAVFRTRRRRVVGSAVGVGAVVVGDAVVVVVVAASGARVRCAIGLGSADVGAGVGVRAAVASSSAAMAERVTAVLLRGVGCADAPVSTAPQPTAVTAASAVIPTLRHTISTGRVCRVGWRDIEAQCG